MKTWITPSLVVITPENAVRSAYDEIKDGCVGFVTTMDEAREVMTLLGMTEEEQDSRVHFAMTGEVLGA